jgi:lipopolysaccharide export LptBFGC system permease protein LptF
MKRERIDKKTREMTVNELTQEIDKSEFDKIDTTPLYVEIYKKINMSVASLVLVLIGIPLGIKAHRSEKSIGFGISLILFAVYWGAFLGGIALALKKAISPALGVSLPNMVFFLLGIVLFTNTARR